MAEARVAIVQAAPEPALEACFGKLDRLVGEAAGAGAALVVAGETWVPGYPAWLDVCPGAALWDHEPARRVFARLRRSSVEVRGEGGARLAAIAARHGVTLVVGVSERVASGRGAGTLYNAILTYGPDGALLNHHRKLVPTHTERLVWGPGDGAGLRAVETPAGRVGALVCWEHFMPLARQALHESREQVHVALWPTVKEMNLVACRQHAMEGRCYVLACGQVLRAGGLPAGLERMAGLEDDAAPVLRGGSAVIGPDGGLVVAPVDDEERVIVADLDLSRIDEAVMTLDVSGHYARPDVLRLRVRRGRRDG